MIKISAVVILGLILFGAIRRLREMIKIILNEEDFRCINSILKNTLFLTIPAGALYLGFKNIDATGYHGIIGNLLQVIQIVVIPAAVIFQAYVITVVGLCCFRTIHSKGEDGEK